MRWASFTHAHENWLHQGKRIFDPTLDVHTPPMMPWIVITRAWLQLGAYEEGQGGYKEF